jgi:hypothetical protein
VNPGLSNTVKDSQILERWIEEQFHGHHDDDTGPAGLMEEILKLLKDDTESKQIRHTLLSLCSLKEEQVVAFCEKLLPTYFLLSVLAMIDTRLEPTMHKWTTNFSKKLALSYREII